MGVYISHLVPGAYTFVLYSCVLWVCPVVCMFIIGVVTRLLFARMSVRRRHFGFHSVNESGLVRLPVSVCKLALLVVWKNNVISSV